MKKGYKWHRNPLNKQWEDVSTLQMYLWLTYDAKQWLKTQKRNNPNTYTRDILECDIIELFRYEQEDYNVNLALLNAQYTA